MGTQFKLIFGKEKCIVVIFGSSPTYDTLEMGEKLVIMEAHK